MLMLRRLMATSRLITPLIFKFHQKSRPTHIPTQSQIMLPFTINNLHDNPGSSRKPKQLGRGRASGKGKTCGRGHKGTWARAGGGVSVRYEGGQTPIHRRLPKYGRGKGKKLYPYLDYLNLGKLQYYIDRGVIDTGKIITIKTLQDAGVVNKVQYGLKILARGKEHFRSSINIQVSDASKDAVEKIKQMNGNISLIYRVPYKFRQFMKPQKHPIPLPEPIPQYDIVRKLDKIEILRGVKVQYRKPKWKLIEQQTAVPIQTEPKFIYPVPRLPDPLKIHKRRQKVYKKITYKI